MTIMGTVLHIKPASKIDDRNDFPSEIDDTFDIRWRVWNLCDSHSAYDFLHFEDIDPELFLTNTKGNELEKFILLFNGNGLAH